MNQLIILPCHSIWKGGDTDGLNQNEWFLAPFQYEGHDHLCFRDHIIKSVEQLRQSPNSILIISGGKTKEVAGPVSEAESYYKLLKRIFSEEEEFLRKRVYIEEFARDSFENVLFLLCRYYEILNYYPEFISVVGFEFKRERFLDCHLEGALNFPRDRVNYIGNSPLPEGGHTNTKYFQNLENAETKHALIHFKTDFYGIKPPLSSKRNERNPFGIKHSYARTNPQLEYLLKRIAEVYSPLSSEEIKKKFNMSW